jgi:hypothetical protein
MEQSAEMTYPKYIVRGASFSTLEKTKCLRGEWDFDFSSDITIGN